MSQDGNRRVTVEREVLMFVWLLGTRPPILPAATLPQPADWGASSVHVGATRGSAWVGSTVRTRAVSTWPRPHPTGILNSHLPDWGGGGGWHPPSPQSWLCGLSSVPPSLPTCVGRALPPCPCCSPQHAGLCGAWHGPGVGRGGGHSLPPAHPPGSPVPGPREPNPNLCVRSRRGAFRIRSLVETNRYWPSPEAA